MNGNTYNGWTNYATWRVNLEILSDYFASRDAEELAALAAQDIYDTVCHLKDVVSFLLDESCPDGIARWYADAFVAEVNYYEIVRNQLADYLTVSASH